MQKQKDTGHTDQQSAQPAGDAEHSQLWLQIQKHYKKIILGIALIILAAAASSGYQYYRTHRLAQAKQELAEIKIQLQGREKFQALQDMQDRIPKDMQTALLLELATVTHELEDFSKAEQYWARLAQTSQDSGLSTAARLGQARALAEQGELEDSLQILDNLLQEAPPVYQRSIYFEIAEVAEQIENWQKALQAYQYLEESEELAARQTDFLQYKTSQLENKLEQDGA